ncbi:MAG: hypothetical protein KKA60_01215 [Proteobacteria bacterium]|nr:hypothetical protein [Pseudomonadota bacterium]
MIADAYYTADFLIALSLPVFFYIQHRTGRFSPMIWKLFWLGFLVGLTWEIPIYFAGPDFMEKPALIYLKEFPGNRLLHPILHSFWDGGLFLIGYWLTLKICQAPILSKFRWKELGVMLVWGQVQEFAVEFSATQAGAWTFTEQCWNPVLFESGRGFITLVPQLIWVYGPIVFYLVSLRLSKSEGGIHGAGL